MLRQLALGSVVTPLFGSMPAMVVGLPEGGAARVVPQGFWSVVVHRR